MENKLKKIKTYKIQPSVSQYIYDVLEALVGRRGNTVSAVADSILCEWVSQKYANEESKRVREMVEKKEKERLGLKGSD